MRKIIYIETLQLGRYPFASVETEEEMIIVDNVLKSMLSDSDFQDTKTDIGWIFTNDDEKWVKEFFNTLKLIGFKMISLGVDSCEQNYTGTWSDYLEKEKGIKVFIDIERLL